MSRSRSPKPPVDPLLDRLDRLVRQARRYAPDARPAAGAGASRSELAAVIVDLALLHVDLKNVRDQIRTQLDGLLAKTRAGDAYRRTAALRPIPGGSSQMPKGPLR